MGNQNWLKDKMFTGPAGQKKRVYPTQPSSPNAPVVYTNPQAAIPQGTQNPYVGTPFESDDGDTYKPTGNDQWESSTQPAGYAANPEWNYQAAPVGADGRPLGMNNEPLPEGAQGWTPFGEPDFGPGLNGWYKGALYNMFDSPERTVIKDIDWLKNQKQAWEQVGQGDLGGALNTSLDFWKNIGANLGALGTELTVDPETGERIASAPGPLGLASKGIGELIKGGGQLLDYLTTTQVESIGGTAAGTLQDLGEGSAIPEFTPESEAMQDLGFQSETGEWRLPNPLTGGKKSWDLGWAQTLANMTPYGLTWNAIRALTAPQKDWDEVKDTLANNWQASRIAYSALNDEALKQEYISRLKSGEDPRLLAMELGQPWQELAGKFVADPLNLIGGGARRGADLIANAEDVFKAAPEIQAVLDGIRNAPELSDATATTKLQDLVTATMRSTENRLTDLAKNARIFGATATSKRANTLKRVGLTLDNIIGASVRSNGTLDTEKALEQIDNLIRLTSKEPDEVAQALGMVMGGARKGAYDAGALLSTAGQEAGLVLRRLLQSDGDGAVDASRFISQLAEAKQKGSAAVAELVNKKLTPALEELFPTTLERVSAIERLKEVNAGAKLADGEDVAKLQRIADLGDTGYLTPFFSRIHRTSRPVYNVVNGFLSGVYMGMSPGYAFRNALGNNFQTFVDLGLGAWKKFNPNDMAEQGFKWGEEFRGNRALGGISSTAAAEGITALKSPIEAKGFFEGLFKALKGSEDLTTLERYGQSMLRVGEYFEQNAAKRIVGYAIDRAMMKLTPKAIPVQELTRMAGLTDEQARTFQALALRYNGDLQAAFKGLRAVDNVSLKSVLLNGVSAEDIQILKDYDIWDDFVKSLDDVGSRDHLFNTMDDTVASLQEIAKGVKSEHVGAGEDVFTQTIQAADELSDNTKALNSNKYTANSQAWQAYREAVNKVFDSAYTLRTDNSQPIQDLAALRNKYAPWTQGVEEGITSQQATQFRESFISAMQSLKGKRPDLGALWKQIGLEGDPPTNLTRDTFRSQAWDYYFSTQNERWTGYRDKLALSMEAFLNELKLAEPGANVTPDFMQEARKLYAHARSLDDAVMSKADGLDVMKPIQGWINDSVKSGNTSNAIRYLAQRYGIGQPNAKLSKYYDNYIAAVLKKYGGFDPKTATLEQAHQAFEARIAAKQGIPQVANLQQWLGKNAETILDPPAGPGVASLPRTLKESLPGLRQYLNELKGKLDQNWGSYIGGALSKEQELSLSNYLKTVANPKMQEARRLAGAVAEAQRKFTILDYADRTNFDLALSMVMPYHFWYSRTYKNWMSRFMQNPKLLADYARYRETLEQIHADSPEWYKYQVNTNELLGIESDNPWHWNLEATLNPLNGLTGVDFTDPNKRVNWFTRTLDDAAKFGPSIWTPFTLATAYGLYNMGEKDAAARWGGRMFPQTATLKAIGALGNLSLPFAGPNNEYDPAVNFFSGGLGLDPYELNRVHRALGAMVQGVNINGEYVQITDEQAIDAAHSQTGEIYDLAAEYALDQRAIPQLQSFLMGVGFKGRTPSDISIDQMYQEYYSLWNMAPNLNPDEFREQMELMRTKYPWMDAVILAKKAGPERDRALAYNALSRVPPGQSGETLELFGLSDEAMQQFYDNKGDLSYMVATDRARFMSGIIELSAALALPEDANRMEWAQVRSQYNAMQDAGKAQFGEEIWNRVSDFFALQKANPEAAKLMIANNPKVQAALEYREQAVMDNPLLFDYYGGIDFLGNYWEGQMYQAAEQKFGAEIFELSGQYGTLSDQEDMLLQQYYDMKDAGDPNAQAFYKAWLDKDSNQKDLFLAQHPELKAYWQLKETYQEEIQRRLVEFEPKLRDVDPALREDYQPQGIYEVPAAAELGYNFQPAPTWSDWQTVLTPSQASLVEDYFADGSLSANMETALERIADSQGLTLEELLQQMEQSYYSEQVAPVP